MAVTKVILAKLSPTMEEGTIVKWNKNEGDAVKSGDVLAEIETDKANMEMEALGSGVLRKVLVPAGGKAPVGALIGVIANADEDISKVLATASAPPPAAPSSAPAKEAKPPAESQPPAAAAQAAPAQPQPQPQAQQASAPAPAPAAQPAPPAAPAAPAASAAAPATEGGRVKASPLARSMAAQQNIPLGSVPGSGPGGRIIKRDIEAWSQGGQASAPSPAPADPAVPAVQPGQQLPLSGMRKTIARRLSESAVQSPHFYVTVEIAMEGAAALREQVQQAEDTKVSYNDIILKACAKALRRYPAVNASWSGDSIAVHADVNVGVAVAINDGLIVPVVRNADRKSLLEVSREVKELAGRARERKLKPEEFAGGTFSISNLGMYDVTAFTAIINPPESAILAVGAVREVPVVKDGAVAVGLRMNVTLGSDHRVIDGALAAQFLAELRRLLEHPVAIFV